MVAFRCCRVAERIKSTKELSSYCTAGEIAPAPPCDNHVARHLRSWPKWRSCYYASAARNILVGLAANKGRATGAGAYSHFPSLPVRPFRNNTVNHSHSLLPHFLLPSAFRTSHQCLSTGTSPNALLSTAQYTLTPRNHPPSHLIITTLQGF